MTSTSQEDIYNEFRRVSKQSYENESSHLEDLWSIPVKGHPVDGKIEVSRCHLQHLSFILRAAIDTVLTLLTDWTLPFKHPLHWLYLIFVYPVVLYILFVVEMVSLIVDTLKLKVIKTAVHKRWSKYTAPEILFDDEFFHMAENISIVDEGVGALDKPYNHEVEHGEESYDITTPHFNLDIAQLFLFMCDIVYNRASEKVLEAKKKIDAIKHHPEERDELLRQIVGLLQESDETINTQAKKWKLRYNSVSELNTLGESYAGIFYSDRHDFIVVTFKGPTVDIFDSFVRDLMFQHVDGRPIIGFEGYHGYRSMLYPETEKPGPYAAIIEAIRNVARVIREKNPKKERINVWVTGHSMGGALATLFYGRCLKSPADLGEHCILRDAYTFGCPPVADSEIASTYLSSMNKRNDVVNTLWHVMDDKDILTKLPLGFYHPDGVGKHNVLDNTHFGEAIRFYQDGKRPKLIKTPHVSGGNQIPTIRSAEPKEDCELHFPVHTFDNKLPSFIRDHMTYRYALALALSRNHLESEDSAKTKGYHNKIILEYE